MKKNVSKLVTISMLCALAFVAVVATRIPLFSAAPFLKYDPKDVVVTIGGFIFGPLASLLISLVVCLIEMFTVSEAGFIGFIMNLFASCSFACTAAFIYKSKHTVKGAIIGLVSGVFTFTAVMLLWNYFIAPLYMSTSPEAIPAMREMVTSMLLPVFLPFNLIKGILNSSLIMILYKPVVGMFRKTHLLPQSNENKKSKYLGLTLFSLFIVVTCIALILVLKGII